MNETCRNVGCNHQADGRCMNAVACAGADGGRSRSFTFEIDRVNEIRMRRGVEGVAVKVFDDGELVGVPWMSAKDIRLNIRDHGESEALTTALECYRQRRDVRVSNGKNETR